MSKLRGCLAGTAGLLALVLSPWNAFGLSAGEPGPDAGLWRRLIAEAGTRGDFFNPNLPELKLAKGIGLQNDGRFYVFSAYPDLHEQGKARVLLLESNCDILALIKQGRRDGCPGYTPAAFLVTDDAQFSAAFRFSQGKWVGLSLEDPAVRQGFSEAKNLWLEYAKKLPDTGYRALTNDANGAALGSITPQNGAQALPAEFQAK